MGAIKRFFADYSGTLAVLIFAGSFISLVFASLNGANERQAKPPFETLEYDGHQFIRIGGQAYFLHHPSCQCNERKSYE